MTTNTLNIRWLARQDYLSCWEAMQHFTHSRDENTIDEIWLLEHNPVFTQGQNGKPEHILNAGNIPVIQTDRGGQVTYHGPGQLMLYILVDLRRKKINIRELVSILENAVIQVLAEYNILAYAKKEAPGVYVDERKICSIGLRIRKGCSYHGIAFNVSLDLEPFSRINPCGYTQLKMTHFAQLGGLDDILESGRKLVSYLTKSLGYTNVHYENTYSSK